MAHVAHVKRIAVRPAVETVQRVHIAIKEGTVRMARAFLGDPPEAMFDPQEAQRLRCETQPVYPSRLRRPFHGWFRIVTANACASTHQYQYDRQSPWGHANLPICARMTYC